jgi:hypothetical protein
MIGHRTELFVRLVSVTVLGVVAVQKFGLADEPRHVLTSSGHAPRDDVAG